MKKFAVIGHPIAHSKSPQLHEAGFADLNIEAEFAALDIRPEDLKTWIQTEFRQNFEGVSITIPHKEAIRDFVDQETEAATQIGAINTLFKKDGLIWGTNTDAIGALRAVQAEVPVLEGKDVLILGAGGAARAVAFALKTAGANITIWNRTSDKAEKLAEAFEVSFKKEFPTSLDDYEIIVNTTPVGLGTNQSIIPAELWKPQHVAFDIVYDPLETQFLFDAESAGARTITGDRMLIFQALEQFKLWHDTELEPEVMGQAFFD
jgi:shikimate dehydrogenase